MMKRNAGNGPLREPHPLGLGIVSVLATIVGLAAPAAAGDDEAEPLGVRTDASPRLAQALVVFDDETADRKLQKLGTRAARRYFALVPYCEASRKALERRDLTHFEWNPKCEKLFADINLRPVRSRYVTTIGPDTRFVLTSIASELYPDEQPRRFDVLAAVVDGRLLPVYAAPGHSIHGFLESPGGTHVAVVRFSPVEQPSSDEQHESKISIGVYNGPERPTPRRLHLEILDLSNLRIEHSSIVEGRDLRAELTWSSSGSELIARATGKFSDTDGEESEEYRCSVDPLECRPADQPTPTGLAAYLNRNRDGLRAIPGSSFQLTRLPAELRRVVWAQPRRGTLLPESIRVGPNETWVAWETRGPGDGDSAASEVERVHLWVLNRESVKKWKVATHDGLHHPRWQSVEDGSPRLLYDRGRIELPQSSKKIGAPTARYDPETKQSTRWFPKLPVRLSAPVVSESRNHR